jgi:hypothetical protein
MGKHIGELATPMMGQIGKDDRSVSSASWRDLPRDELIRFQAREALAAPTKGASTKELDEVTRRELGELDCTTHKLGTKVREPPSRARYARSGGFLVACTPDGFVADATEFMGAESCSQRYIFLARLKELYPALRVLLHDDACHLRRFAAAREHCSEFARELAYPRMHFVLDRFHAPAHVDPWCKVRSAGNHSRGPG